MRTTTVRPCPRHELARRDSFGSSSGLRRWRADAALFGRVGLGAVVGLILWMAPLRSFGQVDAGVAFTRVTSGAIVTDMASSFGCAWGDYDGDGYLDLVVCNGFGDPKALYHNERDGTFAKVVTGVIVESSEDIANGCVWGDFDNDGDNDLFVTYWRVPSHLYRNDGGGTFSRVIQGSMGSNVADSNGAAWGDYDGDGFLDLIVANSGGQNEFLYHNEGDGTFRSIREGPVPNSGRYSGVPCWADVDGNGTLDLYISPAGRLPDSRGLVFRNEGGGEFSRVTLDALTAAGVAASDWGDYDNDGDFDLLGVQWDGGPEATLYIFENQGGWEFSEALINDHPSSVASPGAAMWGDYDNDGWLDAFFTTSSDAAMQNDLLYRNNGDGTFSRIMEGELVNTATWSSAGAAWGDYDNDGFLDLFLANGFTHGRHANLLFHNDGNGNHWLIVKCRGAASNRSGIGAKVGVQATIGGVSRSQLRQVHSGHGFNGSGLRVHFGLGDATVVDRLRIEWPSGTVQELTGVAVDQILTVKEPPVLQAVGENALGHFQLTHKGGIGLEYVVEYSTNVTDWAELMRFTGGSINTSITDGQASTSASRVYRSRELDP